MKQNSTTQGEIGSNLDDSKKTSKKSVDTSIKSMKDMPKRASIKYYLTNIAFSTFIAFFFTLRLFELASMSSIMVMSFIMIVVIIISNIMLYTHVPITNGIWVRRLGLIIMVFLQLKSEMDTSISQFLARPQDLSGSIGVVTNGCDKGLGLEIVRKLISLNATVIIGNSSLCNETIEEILKLQTNTTQGIIHAIDLNLFDLKSVKKFTNIIKKKFPRVDLLINNANSLIHDNQLTSQGLEKSFGMMNVAQAAIIKWLSDHLMKLPDSSHLLPSNPFFKTSRVINIVSNAYLMGNYHPSLLTGSGSGDFQGEFTSNCDHLISHRSINVSSCPYFVYNNQSTTNGYARSQLTWIFFTHEYQKRLDLEKHVKTRRVVMNAVNPGYLDVNEVMTVPIISSVVKLLLRLPEDAVNVVYQAIFSDDYLPGTFIDSMKVNHDLLEYREHFLYHHVHNNPDTNSLSFVSFPIYKQEREFWSIHRLFWFLKKGYFIQSNDASIDPNIENISTETIGARLYDVIEQVIRDFEKNKALFSTPVVTSKLK